MTVKKGFQIDQRVGIAMDALSPRQREVLKPVLRDKEGFIARARRPGMTRKLSASAPIYAMKAGDGLRVIYTVAGDTIVVQDIMRKATMDQFAARRRLKSPLSRKAKTAKEPPAKPHAE